MNNDVPLKLKSKTVNLDQANGFIKHCPKKERGNILSLLVFHFTKTEVII